MISPIYGKNPVYFAAQKFLLPAPYSLLPKAQRNIPHEYNNCYKKL
ncbi:hypothetical protein [Moorena sp. SIO4G3]|nr:hypothetical protein [Moorena sp. SIO4G3]NEO78628.1 hypothetical protein [Moorena sp. SIO4G3]